MVLYVLPHLPGKDYSNALVSIQLYSSQVAVLFDITERKSPYNKPFSAGGGGGGGGGGAGARLAWCGGPVKTHIVCTSVGMKTNRSPRVFSYCRTTSEPGEEVAAAKVLEPPGPGVVEEGGQAPDDDDGDEVTSPCVCEDTFFNVNCISYV